MALIKCKKCGHSISDKAVKCPKCGFSTIKEESVVSIENKKVPEVESSPNSISQEEITPVNATFSTDNNRESQRSKKGFIVGICVLLAISVIIGGGWYWWNKELLPQKMYKELHEAAENGNIDAQYKLGGYYYHGSWRKIKQDYDEAAKWLLKAAEQEHERAIYDLGFCYYDMKKYDEAVKWFRKSADLGESRAQYFLGLCYEKGYGVEQSNDIAAYWYQKASEHGDEEAKQWLAENIIEVDAVEVIEADSTAVVKSETEYIEEKDIFRTDKDVLAFVSGNRYTHEDITLVITENGIFANGNKLGENPKFRQLSKDKGTITTSEISITVRREDNTLVDNNSGDIYYMYYNE